MPICLPFPRMRNVGHAVSLTTVCDPHPSQGLISIAVLVILILLACTIRLVDAAPPQDDDVVCVFKAIRRARIAEAKSQMPIAVGNLHALVVGVSEYANKQFNLHFAAKDARDFANFLQSQRQMFREVHVELLTDKEATKYAIETFLTKKLPLAGKDDTIVLFFSGHGTGNPAMPGQFYFLPFEAEINNLAPTAVRLTAHSLFGNADSRRVVIIADACHSGMVSLFSTKDPVPPLKTFMSQFQESEGKIILTSSKPGQYSYDIPPSGKTFGNSVFTHFLLEGLKGNADENRDFVVGLREAYNYAYSHTKNETGGNQKPGCEGRVVGTFPLAIVSPQQEPVKADVKFFAQNPRCADYNCIDPPGENFQCTDVNCGGIPITEGCTMYTGQNYQIAVRPHERSYVYIYQVDGHNQVYKLFPGDDYMPQGKTTNPLEGGKVHWFPSIDGWLHHGDLEGREKLVVVVSKSRNAQLEALYKNLDDSRMRGGASSADQQASYEMERQLDRLMAPTVAKSIRRRSDTHTGGGRVLEKLRTFNQLATALESAGLDAAASVSYWVKKR